MAVALLRFAGQASEVLRVRPGAPSLSLSRGIKGIPRSANLSDPLLPAVCALGARGAVLEPGPSPLRSSSAGGSSGKLSGRSAGRAGYLRHACYAGRVSSILLSSASRLAVSIHCCANRAALGLLRPPAGRAAILSALARLAAALACAAA